MDPGLAAIMGAIVGALVAFGGAYLIESLRARDLRQRSLGLVLHHAGLLSTYLDAAQHDLLSLVEKREMPRLPSECETLSSVVEHMNFVLEALCTTDHRIVPHSVLVFLNKSVLELNQLREFLSLVAGTGPDRADSQHAQAAQELLGKIQSASACVHALAHTAEKRLSMLHRRRIRQELVELLPGGPTPQTPWRVRLRNMLVAAIDWVLGTPASHREGTR